MLSQDEEYEKNIIQFRIITLVAAGVLLFGMIFYHFVEDLRWLDSLYFCTITLATVGYGDITPKTDAGKLFTVFYVLIGIAIIATFANLALKRAVSRRMHRNAARFSKKSKNSR